MTNELDSFIDTFKIKIEASSTSIFQLNVLPSFVCSFHQRRRGGRLRRKRKRGSRRKEERISFHLNYTAVTKRIIFWPQLSLSFMVFYITFSWNMYFHTLQAYKNPFYTLRPNDTMSSNKFNCLSSVTRIISIAMPLVIYNLLYKTSL